MFTFTSILSLFGAGSGQAVADLAGPYLLTLTSILSLLGLTITHISGKTARRTVVKGNVTGKRPMECGG